MRQKRVNLTSQIVRYLTSVLLLVLFIGGGIYFYIGVWERNNISKTIDDIVIVTQKIADDYGKQKYQMFDTDTAALGDYLPFDIEAEAQGDHYLVPNRFGGQMYFYEAVANKRERDLYFSLYNEPQKYTDIYEGVGAYVILLTQLNKRVCRTLAQIDWPAKISNFMGIEAAYTTPQDLDNGLINLSNYILTDNEDEKIKTTDSGTALRKPLTATQAEKACGCSWRGCSIALKFM